MSFEDNSTTKENTIGILIFDTYKTHTFEQAYIKELGGYLTHKLYEFLNNNNIYLGSSNHSKIQFDANHAKMRVKNNNRKKKRRKNLKT